METFYTTHLFLKSFNFLFWCKRIIEKVVIPQNCDDEINLESECDGDIEDPSF